MRNYNNVTLSGILVADFNVNYVGNNNLAVGKFSIAYNKTSFFDCVCFGDIAVNAKKQLKKGDFVFLQGELKQERYADNQGVAKSFIRVYADVLHWLPKKNEYIPKGDDNLEPVNVNLSEEEIPF